MRRRTLAGSFVNSVRPSRRSLAFPTFVLSCCASKTRSNMNSPRDAKTTHFIECRVLSGEVRPHIWMDTFEFVNARPASTPEQDIFGCSCQFVPFRNCCTRNVFSAATLHNHQSVNNTHVQGSEANEGNGDTRPETDTMMGCSGGAMRWLCVVASDRQNRK